MWQALPDAVYDDSRRLLHVPTGFHMLSYEGNTIYVRECYEQLTQLALAMSPQPPTDIPHALPGDSHTRDCIIADIRMNQNL